MEPMAERYGMTAYGARLGDYRVLLVQDQEGENPRDWENFGTMWFRPSANGWRNDDYRHLGDPNLHDIDDAWRRYCEDERLADDTHLLHKTFARWLRLVKGATNIKSITVLEHSGVTIRYKDAKYIERPDDWGHGSFDGLIFDTTEGRKLANPKSEDDVRRWLTGELDMTKAWVEGDVYIIVTEKHVGCDDGPACDDNECSSWEEIESVGGYYGSDAESEAHQALAELYLTSRPEEAHA